MNQARYMNLDAAAGRTRAARWGWGILLTVSGLLSLNGLLLYFVIVATPQEQTLSILLTGFGVLALVVALEGFRHGSRWAWNGTWVVVGLLAAIGLHMLLVGRLVLSGFYLILAAIALAGQLLAGRGGGISR